MRPNKRSSKSHTSINLEGLAGRNSSAGYRPGTKFVYSCPVCGDNEGEKHGAIIRHLDGWSISCLRCPGGGDYLRELREAVGCDANGYALLDDPLTHLSDLIQQSLPPSSPAALPTPAQVAGWHERLMSSGAPLEYLLTERGLSETIVTRHQLGWDGYAFTLPIYSIDKGHLVNLRRRSWPRPFSNGARYVGLAGRTKRNDGVQLYPDVPHQGGLLVCGGELDALVVRSHGIRGIACTTGVASEWLPTWNRLVRGREVVVAFDVGEEAHARRRVASLAKAGARAWWIDLGSAGLTTKEDLTDWFVVYGRTADDLRRLARKSRPVRATGKGKHRGQ